MKLDIFIYSKNRLRRKAINIISKSKKRLKTAKTNLKTAIETVLFYNSEIKLQFVRFKTNISDLNFKLWN